MRYLLLACCALLITGCATRDRQDDESLSAFGQQPFNLEQFDEAAFGTAGPRHGYGPDGSMIGDLPLSMGPGARFYPPGSPHLDPALSAQAQAVLKTIHFPFDSSTIMPNEAQILQGVAAFMQQNPQVLLQIEGHTCMIGTDEYNMALGSRRASSVRQFLADLGVDPNRLYTISYGEERPVDPGTSNEALARNRRAEFLVGVVGR